VEEDVHLWQPLFCHLANAIDTVRVVTSHRARYFARIERTATVQLRAQSWNKHQFRVYRMRKC
jgi:hypothetical protein